MVRSKRSYALLGSGLVALAMVGRPHAHAQSSAPPPRGPSSGPPSRSNSSAPPTTSSSASPAPSDDPCPARLVPIDRERHCCEPGQRYEAGRCEGAPSVCPSGTSREANATTCTPAACTGGRVRAGDGVHCCWPGQRVGTDEGDRERHPESACTGRVEHCPEGTNRLGEGDCAPMIGPTAGTPRTGIPRGAVAIPGGTYRAASGDRVVTLLPFAIDRTEVTVAQYDACVRAGRCEAARDAFAPARVPQMPRTMVSHTMARAYCGFAGGRLPTEAEWELAARGFDGHAFPWGDRRADCTLARMAGCGDGPAPVGSIRAGASSFGVLDLAGNVAEWVEDRSGPLTGGSFWNPTGPNEGDTRVVRGGSFVDGEGALRSTARRAVDPREARFDVGFRCVY